MKSKTRGNGNYTAGKNIIINDGPRKDDGQKPTAVFVILLVIVILLHCSHCQLSKEICKLKHQTEKKCIHVELKHLEYYP